MIKNCELIMKCQAIIIADKIKKKWESELQKDYITGDKFIGDNGHG